MENIARWRPYPRFGAILLASTKTGLAFTLTANTILVSIYLLAVSLIAGDGVFVWNLENVAAFGSILAASSIVAAVIGSGVGAWVGLCTAGLHANRTDGSYQVQLKYANAGTLAGLVSSFVLFAEPILGYSVVTEAHLLGLPLAAFFGLRLNKILLSQRAPSVGL